MKEQETHLILHEHDDDDDDDDMMMMISANYSILLRIIPWQVILIIK